MGPPIFIGGKAEIDERYPAPQASMGPPIFIGGKGPTSTISTAGYIRFNGATDFYRWKGERATRGATNGTSFNGATDFYRWKGTASASVG